MGGKFTSWDIDLFQTEEAADKYWTDQMQIHGSWGGCCGSCINMIDRMMLGPGVLAKNNKVDWI